MSSVGHLIQRKVLFLQIKIMSGKGNLTFQNIWSVLMDVLQKDSEHARFLHVFRAYWQLTNVLWYLIFHCFSFKMMLTLMVWYCLIVFAFVFDVFSCFCISYLGRIAQTTGAHSVSHKDRFFSFLQNPYPVGHFADHRCWNKNNVEVTNCAWYALTNYMDW